MDLAAEAERLRLDVLAVEVSRCLAGAGLPHALLKGPSTANWLYRPPRRYRDVDVLIAPDRLPEVVAALQRADVATAVAGTAGEEAEHSLLMISREGFEVDVHLSLPAVPVLGGRIWVVLGDHVEDLDLGVGQVPALDETGRCLVLALHALNNARHESQAVEDLRRARRVATPDSWTQARLLAERIGIVDLFDGGVASADPLDPLDPLTASAAGGRSPRARLFAAGAPNAAFGLQRLSERPVRELPAAIWREILPSRGFMLRQDEHLGAGRSSLLRAHLRRWRALATQLPAAVRAWRQARH